jgi:small subunit ribosomal protein S1
LSDEHENPDAGPSLETGLTEPARPNGAETDSSDTSSATAATAPESPAAEAEAPPPPPTAEAEVTPPTPAAEAEATTPFPTAEAEAPPPTPAVEADASAPAPAAEEPAPDSTRPDHDEASAREAPHARRKARFPALVRAFRSGRPVDGKITQVIKGGYEVRVGRARGFCPHSQIDLHREEEPERQVGRTYVFKITQLRRGGEDIVLSRRAVLEADREEEAKAVRATLIQGAVMQGHVVGTAPFGAFIDLGAGVLGLAHISELSHKRIKTVEEAVQVGETVRVRILKLKESGRISLSIRRAEDDPWAEVERKFEIGRVYPGTLQRVADFGAFVELAPGVEALAPASEFPPSSGGWKGGLQVGATSDWHVLSVDAKARRVSVTPPGPAAASGPLAEGAELEGHVQRVERYGVFVWLGPGRVGLMPRAMTGAPEGTDLSRRFRIGDSVAVTVVEIDDDGRRIRLCKKGVQPRVEQEDTPASESRETRPEEEPAEAFGTSLADKLRAALGQSDRESS